MPRTRHRRRFHTDRVVAARRARYRHETNERVEFRAINHDEWQARLMSYGRLADRDPWDCGSSCWLCHWEKKEGGRRTREKREWRADLAG